jgi:putative glutamine amidotransferase
VTVPTDPARLAPADPSRPPPAGGRPLVAVVAGCSPPERYSVHRGYVEAVTAVGAVAVVVPAGADVDADAVCALVRSCDGVILTGGGDVTSAGGPGAAVPLLHPDPARDAIEVRIVREALDAGRRLLGVCRGAQVIAVATGGSLIPDLAAAGLHGHWDEDHQYEPVHPVATEPGSLASAVLGSVDMVNSIHHQAVGDPGPLLRPGAWGPQGVIEAVEGGGLLGVQWHPERLVGTDPRHLAPFYWALGR